MDVDLLRAFVGVAERRSFTHAASALNRTQSSVSVQVKRLEELVGAPLLERSRRHVALTPAGEDFLSYARRILALGEEAVDRLRGQDLAGAVRIGVMEDYGTFIMPALVASFAARHPGVRIEMETGLTASMPKRLGLDFDLVIAMHAAGHESGYLLWREQAVWAGSPDAGHLAKVDVLPLALYPAGCLFRRWATEALDHTGRRWRLAFVSHSQAAVEAICAQGLAVTVVKRRTFSGALRLLDAADDLPTLPSADIRLHEAKALSPAARGFAEHIRQSFADASEANAAEWK